MTRRAYVLLVLLAVATVTLILTRPAPAILRTAEQNVLVITIDTLRADTLRVVAAPAIRRLASIGTSYTFAHAHAVVTLPSHTSILTGLYPHEHGVRDNLGFRVSAETVTLAERLKQAGFATGAFVSAFPLDRQFGLNAGFDTYDDQRDDAPEPVDFLAPERGGHRTVTSARAWLAQQRSRWFAWVHLFEPHAPYRPPERLRRRYGSDLKGMYAGEVALADEMLEPLLDEVQRSERPTMVILTSDHGEGLGDHGELTHGVFAYESTLHVPLILAQFREDTRPVDPPRVIDEPVRHIDLVPSILDALEQPPAEELPGRSLLRRAPLDASSYFEAMEMTLTRGWAPLTGVIAGRSKLVDLPVPELYDLAADRRETTNLYARDAATRTRLESLLASFGAGHPERQVADDRETIERLRALGYVGGSAPRRASYTEEDDPKRLVHLDRDMHQAGWLYETGQPAESIALYRKILEERPAMEPAWRFMAFVQWQSGDRRGAIASLEEAIRRGVATDETRRQLAEYLETGAITPESGG